MQTPVSIRIKNRFLVSNYQVSLAWPLTHFQNSPALLISRPNFVSKEYCIPHIYTTYGARLELTERYKAGKDALQFSQTTKATYSDPKARSNSRRKMSMFSPTEYNTTPGPGRREGSCLQILIMIEGPWPN